MSRWLIARPLVLLVLLPLALSLGTSGCGTGTDGDSTDTGTGAQVVSVMGAWARASEGGEMPDMTGAFASIVNQGERDVTLTGVTSPVAGRAELHEMSMTDDGQMTMAEVKDGFVIAAGQTLLLEPGGNHIMLMDLTAPTVAGEEISATLQFSDGSEVEVTLPVKEFTEEVPHYHSTQPAPTAATNAP